MWIAFGYFDESLIMNHKFLLKAPLVRYEQKQKDLDELKEDSWDTETLLTTFDLDEIETEIEVDYWVSFLVQKSRLNRFAASWRYINRIIWVQHLIFIERSHFKHNQPNENFDLNLADLDDLGLDSDEEIKEVKTQEIFRFLTFEKRLQPIRRVKSGNLQSRHHRWKWQIKMLQFHACHLHQLSNE